MNASSGVFLKLGCMDVDVSRGEPLSSSIITYLWMECYTQFHMNTSKRKLM